MELTERIAVVEGDITGLDVDAIVNAANEGLAPGGGVCGAIHRAAGPKLAEECTAFDGCPTGEAVLTAGYDLAARHVIHAVGPVWSGGGANEDALLADCYRKAMEIAAMNRLESIAFPAISTGIFGFPLERATAIAVDTVAALLRDSEHPARVLFCCFSADDARAYRETLAARGLAG